MAVGGVDKYQWSRNYQDNLDQQIEEVLACQSFFDGEEEQRFGIITEGPQDACDEATEVFQVEFMVPVRLRDEQILVNICLPSDDSSEVLHDDLIIQTHSMKYLTPLDLSVTLPPEYPSETPPVFTLSATWLDSKQVTSLNFQLMLLWEECQPMPILNTWIDWLEHNTLSFLGMNCINLTIQDEGNGVNPLTAPDKGQDDYSVEDILNDLFRYNQHKETINFLQYDQECPICFAVKTGRDLYRFLPCKHYFCKECVSDFCNVHIVDGSVQNLKCPEQKCNTEIHPHIIMESVTKEMFERWERLTLQKGLDAMGDIAYCPRCQVAVVKDHNTLNLAHCIPCQYTFCLECLDPVHPGDVCYFKKIEEQEEEVEEEAEDDEKFLQKIRIMEEIKSKKFVKERTKTCPKCNSPIVKISGCNSVICTVCHTKMCYACEEDISSQGYFHFTNNPDCNLYIVHQETFGLKEPPPKIQYLQSRIEVGDSTVRYVRCPMCEENNVRNGDNSNLIVCWNCKSEFCYLCLKKLRKPFYRHFRLTKCTEFFQP